MEEERKKIREDTFYQRTVALLGEEALLRLLHAKVAVCGLGGVGAACAEALARSGVGALRLIDYDIISRSNLNRQLHTTLQTVGESKAAVLRERIFTICPHCQVEARTEKVTEASVADLLADVDYLVDAVDDIPAKIAIACFARKQEIPLVSSMGTGNKLHPEQLELADISQTEVCPLARKLRRELRRLGITKGISVVYSKESPKKTGTFDGPPASIAFVPPVAGMILAGKVVRDLCGVE